LITSWTRCISKNEMSLPQFFRFLLNLHLRGQTTAIFAFLLGRKEVITGNESHVAGTRFPTQLPS
jgi:hypothetical protein